MLQRRGFKTSRLIAVGINRDWCISFKRNAPKMSPACHYGREAALYVQASRPKSVARVSMSPRFELPVTSRNVGDPLT